MYISVFLCLPFLRGLLFSAKASTVIANNNTVVVLKYLIRFKACNLCFFEARIDSLKDLLWFKNISYVRHFFVHPESKLKPSFAVSRLGWWCTWCGSWCQPLSSSVSASTFSPSPTGPWPCPSTWDGNLWVVVIVKSWVNKQAGSWLAAQEWTTN